MGQVCPQLIEELAALLSKHIPSLQLCLSLMVQERTPHGVSGVETGKPGPFQPFPTHGKTCPPPESYISSHLIFCLHPLPLRPVNICSLSGKLGYRSSEFRPTHRLHFSAAFRLLSALRARQTEEPRAILLEKAIFQQDKTANIFSPIPRPASETALGICINISH